MSCMRATTTFQHSPTNQHPATARQTPREKTGNTIMTRAFLVICERRSIKDIFLNSEILDYWK